MLCLRNVGNFPLSGILPSRNWNKVFDTGSGEKRSSSILENRQSPYAEVQYMAPMCSVECCPRFLQCGELTTFTYFMCVCCVCVGG